MQYYACSYQKRYNKLPIGSSRDGDLRRERPRESMGAAVFNTHFMRVKLACVE
jgi:hypothetical protein